MTARQNVERTPTKRAFSISEVSQVSGISRTRIYEEIKEKNLRVAKCGRRTLVLAEDLDMWLRSLRGAS